MPIVDLLRASVERAPARTALVHGERRITYGELWSRVLASAALLRQAGMAPGGRVGLLMENTPEYVAAYYGILAAGGVVVALNTQARSADMAHQLTHAGATLLVADPRHRELTPLRTLSRGMQVIEDAVPWDHAADETCLCPSDPEAPAAIIYTSGTTGKPKGVTLSQRNLDANTRSILAYLELRADDVIVNVLPFYYSYGNSVLHTHLAAGACLILDRSLSYPHAVLEAMSNEGATGFSGVPSTYNVLLARTRLADYDLRTLRYLTQAGGAMAPDQVARVRSLLPQARFFVMYGQTEATARLTWLPPERFEDKRGSVGIPIPGVHIEIRDESGRVVDPGVTGELCARGENVMLGYWNDLDSTRSTVDDGWLKTGDLAHQDRDGYIFIDGRRSEMIKVGAHRISPAEVEEVIATIDGVDEVACTGVPDPLLGQVVKAVVVARKGADLDSWRVQRRCRERLAAYKVPRVVEFAAMLPRTASGKVKRYLLAGNGDTKGERDVSRSEQSCGTTAFDR